MKNDKSDFVGSGWSFGEYEDGIRQKRFGVHIDGRGRVALSRREHDIEEAIRLILLTPKGQRVMRPEFGCQIHDLIFAPNDATTAGMATFYVEEALTFWEPRIRVIDVIAEPDQSNDGRLNLRIEYEIKATYDRRSLVFPFYRIPGE